MPVDSSITFEAAIAYTEDLLAQVQAGQTVDMAAEIAALVSSPNGARGFFVTFLTGESPLADDLPLPILQGLRSAPEQVASLLAKNLAMSTAMAITHRRHHRDEMAAGSDRVQRRSMNLIQQLQLATVIEQVQAMQHSAKVSVAAAAGAPERQRHPLPYEAFLTRWGYDADQRAAIAQACTETLQAAE